MKSFIIYFAVFAYGNDSDRANWIDVWLDGVDQMMTQSECEQFAENNTQPIIVDLYSDKAIISKVVPMCGNYNDYLIQQTKLRQQYLTSGI